MWDRGVKEEALEHLERWDVYLPESPPTNVNMHLWRLKWVGRWVGWERHQNAGACQRIGARGWCHIDSPSLKRTASSHLQVGRAPKEISSSYFLPLIFRDKLLVSGGYLFWGWHAKFCRFQTLILHWGTLRPWFVVKFSVDQKKIDLNGPENMTLICWIAVLELDDHQCIQRQFFEEITSSVQLSNLIYLNLI